MDFSITLTIDFILLVILLFSAGWMFFMVSGYGGLVGKSFRIIGWGSIIMATSHLIEVFTFYLSWHDTYIFMLLHRFLATIGFFIIVIDFRRLIQSK